MVSSKLTQGFPGGSDSKKCRRPTMRKSWVQSLGWEDPLEEDTEIHSSTLVWRIPMDRGAWRATVHGLAKKWTQLKRLSSGSSKLTRISQQFSPWKASVCWKVKPASVRARVRNRGAKIYKCLRYRVYIQIFFSHSFLILPFLTLSISYCLYSWFYVP